MAQFPDLLLDDQVFLALRLDSRSDVDTTAGTVTGFELQVATARALHVGCRDIAQGVIATPVCTVDAIIKFLIGFRCQVLDAVNEEPPSGR